MFRILRTLYSGELREKETKKYVETYRRVGERINEYEEIPVIARSFRRECPNLCLGIWDVWQVDGTCYERSIDGGFLSRRFAGISSL